mgnify:CR=1 FL=1
MPDSGRADPFFLLSEERVDGEEESVGVARKPAKRILEESLIPTGSEHMRGGLSQTPSETAHVVSESARLPRRPADHIVQEERSFATTAGTRATATRTATPTAGKTVASFAESTVRRVNDFAKLHSSRRNRLAAARCFQG